MRKFLASVILLASLVGGGVFGYWLVDKNTAAANWGKAAYTAERDWSYLDVWRYEQKQPIYIFLENQLMGKYEGGEWYSLSSIENKESKKFHLADILAVPSYQLYGAERFTEESNTIGWDMSPPGVAWFTPQQQAEMWKLAGGQSSDWGYVELPLQIHDQNLHRLAIPDYNADRFFWNRDKWGYDKLDEQSLVLNAGHDPLPKRLEQKKKLPKDYRQYFLSFFEREGMGEAAIVVKTYYQGDMDNDGEDESIIVLENSTDDSAFFETEYDKKDYGLYSCMFYIDGESVQEIYKNIVLCPGEDAIMHDTLEERTHFRSNIRIYDLNGDGKLECYAKIGSYEHTKQVVYALNGQDMYEEVLCNEHGSWRGTDDEESPADASVSDDPLASENVVAENRLGKRGRALATYDWSYGDMQHYEEKQPIYIFLYNYFMGKYEDGKWYSLESDYGEERTLFYLKDLVLIPSLKLYNMEQLLAEEATLSWKWDVFEWAWPDKKLRERQEKALAELMTKAEDGFTQKGDVYIIQLPNRIRDKNLRGLYLSDYNNNWGYKGKYRRKYGGGEAWLLETNAEHDPRPKSVKQGGDLPEEYMAYFQELFKREGIGDAQVVVLGHYRYDADNDGEDEHVIILRNTAEDMAFYQAARGKKDYGLYNYIFYADGERIQMIYQNVLHCTGNEASRMNVDTMMLTYTDPVIGVYDLNGDGQLELCVQIDEYEWGELVVYALNGNNEYEEVLFSGYGM